MVSFDFKFMHGGSLWLLGCVHHYYFFYEKSSDHGALYYTTLTSLLFYALGFHFYQ